MTRPTSTDRGVAVRLVRRLVLGLVGAFALVLLGSWSANADSAKPDARTAERAPAGVVGTVVKGTVGKVRAVTESAPTKRSVPTRSRTARRPVAQKATATVRTVRKNVTAPVAAKAQKTVTRTTTTVDAAASTVDRVAQRAPVVRRVVPDHAVSRTVAPVTRQLNRVVPASENLLDEVADVDADVDVDVVVDGRLGSGRLRAEPAVPTAVQTPIASSRTTAPDAGPPAAADQEGRQALAPRPLSHSAGQFHDVVADDAALATSTAVTSTGDHRTPGGDPWTPGAAAGSSSASSSGGSGGPADAIGALSGEPFTAEDVSAQTVRRSDWGLPSSAAQEPGSSPD